MSDYCSSVFHFRGREIAPTVEAWAGNEKEPRLLETVWLLGRFIHLRELENRHAESIRRRRDRASFFRHK